MDNNDCLRLMIVDDEPLARMRLRGLLADLALPVNVAGEAGSAAEALHLLSRGPVDAVLLDIHMPGSDGLALARRSAGTGLTNLSSLRRKSTDRPSAGSGAPTQPRRSRQTDRTILYRNDIGALQTAPRLLLYAASSLSGRRRCKR